MADPAKANVKVETEAPIKRGLELEPYQVVLRPLITEKAAHQANPPERYGDEDERGRRKVRRAAYTFEVNPQAGKEEIKRAVESLFKVEVDSVRTQNRRGKVRRYRAKLGRSRNWKKAIVTLRGDHSIDLF